MAAKRKVKSKKAVVNQPEDWQEQVRDLKELIEANDYLLDMCRRMFSEELFQIGSTDDEPMLAAVFSMVKEAEAGSKKMVDAVYTLQRGPKEPAKAGAA